MGKLAMEVAVPVIARTRDKGKGTKHSYRKWHRQSWIQKHDSWRIMFKGVGVTPKKAFSPLISHGMSGMWWSNEILADKQTLRITLKKAANKYAVKKYVAEHSLQKSKDNWQESQLKCPTWI